MWYESDTGRPHSSRESALLWVLVIFLAIVLMTLVGFTIFKSMAASATFISAPEKDARGAERR